MVDPIVLSLAKSAILSKFDTSYEIDRKKLKEKYPFLAKKGAAFVTLNKAEALRGCIGSIIAHQSLLDDIIQNVQSAAFSDPRFAPLSQEELNDLTLEVSILTEPKLLEYSDFEDLVAKVRPKVDGLILKYGQFQGTFLPQVWEQLPNPESFLEHLSYKAGANPSIYEYHPEIYRYEVEEIKEQWDAIPPL